MEGQYLKEDIPSFSGDIRFKCNGEIKFANGSKFAIKYLEEEYKINLETPGTQISWDKGKRFTFFVLLQLRIYNIQAIKVMELIRYQKKKYSVRRTRYMKR